MRHSEQRFETGIHWRSQAFQSQLGEDPVFSSQRDGVGDGCDGHHFHERGQQASSISFRNSALDQALGQFESHSR
ncbi:MAG: hypothetical protein ACREMY_28865, partial [bacterium]